MAAEQADRAERRAFGDQLLLYAALVVAVIAFLGIAFALQTFYLGVGLRAMRRSALQIDRNVAAMFLFGPLSADQNDRYLVPLFGHANKETRESAIYMGTAALTPAALKALKALDRKTVSKELTSVIDSVLFRHQVKLDAKPKYTREQILAKLRKFPEMDESDYSENESKEIDKSIILTLNKDDVPALRDARARSFTSVSDESLYRYRDLTNLLLTLVNRLDLYSEDRIAPVAK